ncbi:hypothetical protein D3C85_1089400 [compost metagenome]
MRGLWRRFQRGDATDVGAVFGWGPDQFDAVAEIGDVLAVSQSDLHDIDHFPIAILAGVEAVTLEAAVGLLFNAEANAGAGLFEGAELVFGVEGAVAEAGRPENRDQTAKSSRRGRPDGTYCRDDKRGNA